MNDKQITVRKVFWVGDGQTDIFEGETAASGEQQLTLYEALEALNDAVDRFVINLAGLVERMADVETMAEFVDDAIKEARDIKAKERQRSREDVRRKRREMFGKRR